MKLTSDQPRPPHNAKSNQKQNKQHFPKIWAVLSLTRAARAPAGNWLTKVLELGSNIILSPRHQLTQHHQLCRFSIRGGLVSDCHLQKKFLCFANVFLRCKTYKPPESTLPMEEQLPDNIITAQFMSSPLEYVGMPNYGKLDAANKAWRVTRGPLLQPALLRNR